MPTTVIHCSLTGCWSGKYYIHRCLSHTLLDVYKVCLDLLYSSSLTEPAVYCPQRQTHFKADYWFLVTSGQNETRQWPSTHSLAAFLHATKKNWRERERESVSDEVILTQVTYLKTLYCVSLPTAFQSAGISCIVFSFLPRASLSRSLKLLVIGM